MLLQFGTRSTFLYTPPPSNFVARLTPSACFAGVLCEHLGFKLSNRQLRKALEGSSSTPALGSRPAVALQFTVPAKLTFASLFAAAMDEDKSGEVSFDEFSDWWAAAGLGKGNLEREGMLWDAFCDIDKDDSGFIDKDELKALTIAVRQ